METTTLFKLGAVSWRGKDLNYKIYIEQPNFNSIYNTHEEWDIFAEVELSVDNNSFIGLSHVKNICGPRSIIDQLVEDKIHNEALPAAIVSLEKEIERVAELQPYDDIRQQTAWWINFMITNKSA